MLHCSQPAELPEAAFQTPQLREQLMRTRDEFAASVQILFVEEHVVVGPGRKGTQ